MMGLIPHTVNHSRLWFALILSFLNWISFLPKLWDFAGLHWEDWRRWRSWPDTGTDDFSGWYTPITFNHFSHSDTLARQGYTYCWNNHLQSSSGWDDEDRWSSEDEHNYEVTRTHDINFILIIIDHIIIQLYGRTLLSLESSQRAQGSPMQTHSCQESRLARTLLHRPPGILSETNFQTFELYFWNSDQLESQLTTASPLERWQGKLCSSFLFILFSSQFSWVYSLHSSNQPSIQPIKFDFQGVGENLRLWRTMLWGWQILLQHLEGDHLLIPLQLFPHLDFHPKILKSLLPEICSTDSVLPQRIALFGQILIFLFSAMQCLWLRLVKGDISGKVKYIEFFFFIQNGRVRTVQWWAPSEWFLYHADNKKGNYYAVAV